MVRSLFAYLSAVVVTAVLGSVANTQFVAAGLVDVGVDIPLADRLSWTISDLATFGPLYGILIAIAFLIALPVAAAIARGLPQLRNLGFILAGVAGLFAIMWFAEFAAQGIVMITGARTTAGMVAQLVIGGVGGWLFAMLRPPRPALV